MTRTLLSTVALVALVASTGVAVAQTASGAYLAARQAAKGNDFDSAASYYTRALARDPQNVELMEDMIFAQLGAGELERALPIARLMEAQGLRSQAAHMAVAAEMLQREDYAGFLDRDTSEKGIGPLVDGLLEAWALVGTDDLDAAMAAFDEISKQQGLRGFALYHKALALAATGDFDAAEGVLSVDTGLTTITRGSVLARAQILSQLGRNEEALEAIQSAFGAEMDPELMAYVAPLSEGQTLPFTHVRSARDGAAEVYYTLAEALRNEAGLNYTLLYGRIAQYLRPEHVDALLFNAEVLEELGQSDLAADTYRLVPQDHPAFYAAELGRAASLRRSDKMEAAVEVLEQLAKTYPEVAQVHSTLGDVYRQLEDWGGAVESYDTALSLLSEGARSAWFLHYTRAISFERLGSWPEAEADFRRALELRPGQPQVLNYLGYSLVEKKVKLDEALELIEQAVAASPDSGYIVDSLGWVLYRLGRYNEAVVHMERAVELMPVDPVVNDHLGDVYWAVGRFREAEFQWSRALSFVDESDPGEAEPDRIRRKLDVGLDAVLAEEGAPPLQVANDEG